MAQNKHVKRARNDGYQGVSFQKWTRQTLGMLDEVTFQDGGDLEALTSISSAWNRAQSAQEPT